MNFKFALPALALAAAAGFTAPANAAVPVYPNYGTENPADYSDAFVLANTGNVSMYYLGGITFGYRAIFSYSVNGGAFVDVLDSYPADAGDLFNLGSFNAGDVFEFKLTLTKPVGVAGNEIYSTPSSNLGGLQQVYGAAYSGGDFGIPTGNYAYLAFEDVLGNNDGVQDSDFDYNDQRFAFFSPGRPNVFEIPVVPEPATWAMLITGFGMVGFAMRRRKQSISVVTA